GPRELFGAYGRGAVRLRRLVRVALLLGRVVELAHHVARTEARRELHEVAQKWLGHLVLPIHLEAHRPDYVAPEAVDAFLEVLLLLGKDEVDHGLPLRRRWLERRAWGGRGPDRARCRARGPWRAGRAARRWGRKGRSASHRASAFRPRGRG